MDPSWAGLVDGLRSPVPFRRRRQRDPRTEPSACHDDSKTRRHDGDRLAPAFRPASRGQRDLGTRKPAGNRFGLCVPRSRCPLPRGARPNRSPGHVTRNVVPFVPSCRRAQAVGRSTSRCPEIALLQESRAGGGRRNHARLPTAEPAVSMPGNHVVGPVADGSRNDDQRAGERPGIPQMPGNAEGGIRPGEDSPLVDHDKAVGERTGRAGRLQRTRRRVGRQRRESEMSLRVARDDEAYDPSAEIADAVEQDDRHGPSDRRQLVPELFLLRLQVPVRVW